MLNAFRSKKRGKGAGIIVWALLGLLIVGLTGLGLGGAVSSLRSQNVATVGDEPVPTEDFVRALLRQLDALGQQTGRRLTMAEAQAVGLDSSVLANRIAIAALDGQANRLKLSVDDRIVRDQLLEATAFQGLSGGFDQQAYNFFLDRQGLSAHEFEEQLRKDATRTLLSTAVSSGMEMPQVFARTVMGYLGERRGFSVVELAPDPRAEALPPPDEAALKAHYEANPDAYTAPETRRVEYAALTLEDAAAAVDVPEDRIVAAFEARQSSLNTPERRIVDAIAFPNTEEAAAARTRLDGGEITFEQLAEERGVPAANLSLGAIEREALGAAAREAVFGAEGPGIVGPVVTDLGPTLYRLNAVIAARTAALDDVRDALRRELARAEAGDTVANAGEAVQDLLASGATLPEIAQETPLVHGTIDLTAEPGEGLAGDAAFRAEAFEAEVGEERDLIDLSGGGIAALKVTEIIPPALRPFEDVRETVFADVTAAGLRSQLVGEAEAMRAELDEGRTLQAVAEQRGLTVTTRDPVRRTDTLDADLPAGLSETLFGLEEGRTAVVEDSSGVFLVRLDSVVPFDDLGDEGRAQMARVTESLGAQAAEDLLNAYTQALTDRAGVSVNQQLIADTLAQYP